MAPENGYVDEESLEDLVEEHDVPLAGTPRSRAPFPSVAPDGRTLEDYFRSARAEGKQDRMVPPVTREVRRRSTPPAAAEKYLGLSIRKTLKRARDAGWPVVRLDFSLVAVSDEFYAADSKKKPGEENPANRRGDLKTLAHIDRHWWLHASHPAFKMGFAAHWTEGVTPKGGRSFGFQSAIATDPVGMPTEFFADYSLDANAKKQQKDEPGHIYESRLALLEANARRRDYDYNDGISWLNTRALFTAYKDFDAWFTEAIAMTTPRPEETS